MNARTWIRVALALRCGRCNRTLQQGDAVLVIEMTRPDRTLRFFRCETCEGPAPPELPAFIERTNEITPTPLRRVTGLLPLWARPASTTDDRDWKTRAAEREPGEDG
jgi:hypothetical protein